MRERTTPLAMVNLDAAGRPPAAVARCANEQRAIATRVGPACPHRRHELKAFMVPTGIAFAEAVESGVEVHRGDARGGIEAAGLARHVDGDLDLASSSALAQDALGLVGRDRHEPRL